MNQNQYNLQGRTAVVTGGASGIGRAITERLLRSGASVAIWDLNVKQARKTASEFSALGRVEEFGVDVRYHEEVRKCAYESRERFGALDILVNSAGIIGPEAPLWECNALEWRGVMEVNLWGTFNCCRAVVPFMLKKGYGRIVNIASIAGKEGNPRLSGYSASKAGIIALTKSLAKELAETNIMANVVTPAAAETPLLGQMSPERSDWMKSLIPMKRFIRVEEIASLVGWLSSEECSASTGAVFDITGGRATY